MATLKSTLKSWFETNDKPSQSQFWAWIDSFYHKDEKIPITAIDDIENILNDKADAEALTNHLGDANAHSELFVQPLERIAALEAKTDSENTWKTIPNPGYSLNPATRVLTMNAGWEGIINGIDYTNVAAQELAPAIPLADAGYSRIDLIVFNTDSTFVRVPGEQSTTTPVAPPLPANTIEATFLTVSDGVVNAPVTPKPKAPVTSVQGMRGDVILKVINDLVTGGIYDFLSAEQGKVLKTQIDGINTLLTSDNVNLDNVQELVDAIETVQLSLSTILVNDLTTGGTTKALTAEMGKTLKGLIDGLTTNKVDKVAGERLINAAEITKLAGLTEGNVTTTVKPILSTALASQNVAGFVTYINALTPVLVVGASEIVKYNLTDTGRIFELLLRGRSFGVGQPAVVAADVLEVTDFLNKDIKLSNYPSTRNDGALSINKVLSTDVNGNLKMYTMAVMPAPFLEILIPDSTLPSTTTNFVLKGAFFTPTMTVVIAGQTINYITFVSDNQVKVNVTTGAAEGSYAVTLNNGISATFNNALLIVLGTVYSPEATDWINISEPINFEKGKALLKTPYSLGSARWNKVFDTTKNFRILFKLTFSPFTVATEANTLSAGVPFYLKSVVDDSVLFKFNNYRNQYTELQLADGTRVNIFSGDGEFNSSNFRLDHVAGIWYLYKNNVLIKTISQFNSIAYNVYAVFAVQGWDVIDIKYIETT